MAMAYNEMLRNQDLPADFAQRVGAMGQRGGSIDPSAYQMQGEPVSNMQYEQQMFTAPNTARQAGNQGGMYYASGAGLEPQQGGSSQYSMGTPQRYSDKKSSNPIDERDKAAAKQRQKEVESAKKISEKEIAARLKIAQMQSGNSSENTAAQLQAERERIAQAKLEMEKLGIPKLDLDRWEAEQTVRLQSAAQAIDRDRLTFEQANAGANLEFEKAKWRDQNANEIRAADFNERSFTQNLDFEREREANRLGLDTATYKQQKDEEDRRYAMDLEQHGFTNNLALRQQAAAESQYAESMGWDKQKFAESQRQQAEQFAATYGLDRDKFAADTALKERQQGFAEDQFRQTMSNRQQEFARTQALEEQKQRASEQQFGATFGEGQRQFDLTTAEGRRQFNEQQALRERQQGAQEAQFGATFGEGQRQFNTQTALDVAKTGASMGGPGDWANFLDYSEGVQNAGDAPVFLQRMLGVPGVGGQAPTGTAPPPRTLAGVAGRLAGVAPQGAPDQQQQQGAPPGAAQQAGQPVAGVPPAPSQSAQQVASLVRANPPSQGAGWNQRDMKTLSAIDQVYRQPHRAEGYGALSSDQRAFLSGGAAKAGYSDATFQDSWRKSRAGQGSVLG